MEHTTKQEIVKALKSYMSEHNMKPADVSTKTGVNQGYLSLILAEGSNFMYNANGQNGFIANKHFFALANLCGFKLEKEYWQLQPTPQMAATLAHLQSANEAAQTLAIIGETGSGKTYSVDLFALKFPMSTFVVTAGSSDTLNDLIDKIMEAMSIPNEMVRKSAKIRAIAQKMRTIKFSGVTPTLIIDESEFLKQPGLCAIKGIHDFVKDYGSLVLIGTSQLVDNIERLKKRNTAGIPQFHRRIKMGLRILPNINTTTQFELFLNEITDRELKKFLLRNCNNYGELHDVLVPAMREGDRLGEPLTMELVRKVLNLPEGDIRW